MPFVTIDGQALHYIDQGTGPAVLLAGSYLWDQAMWAPQIAALSQQYRVIALDLWGHGESGPTAGRHARRWMTSHVRRWRCSIIWTSIASPWSACRWVACGACAWRCRHRSGSTGWC